MRGRAKLMERGIRKKRKKTKFKSITKQREGKN